MKRIFGRLCRLSEARVRDVSHITGGRGYDKCSRCGYRGGHYVKNANSCKSGCRGVPELSAAIGKTNNERKRTHWVIDSSFVSSGDINRDVAHLIESMRRVADEGGADCANFKAYTSSSHHKANSFYELFGVTVEHWGTNSSDAKPMAIPRRVSKGDLVVVIGQLNEEDAAEAVKLDGCRVICLSDNPRESTVEDIQFLDVITNLGPRD